MRYASRMHLSPDVARVPGEWLREPTRWRSCFGEWVSDTGAAHAAHLLAERGLPVTPDAVYKWVAGVRVPRLEAALALVEISGGRLQVTDVLLQRLYVHELRMRTCAMRDGPSLS